MHELRAENVRPKQGKFYQPELDALRFFAFLCVFAFHIPFSVKWRLVPGSFGVSLFFVLSAYLLLTIMLRERQTTGHVAWGSFAARRILRIWPLYFAVIAISYAIGAFAPEMMPSRHALKYLLLLSGNIFVMRFGWAPIPETVGVLWSISVEEQFYALLPVLSRASKRTITVVCCIVIAVSYITLIRTSRPFIDVWPNSFAQFQFFALGALIALYPQKPLRSVAGRTLLFTAGIALWCSSNGTQALSTFLADLLGTIAIFYSVLGIKAHIPALIRYLGKISYGLYVFHLFWLWAVFQRPVTPFFLAHRIAGAAVALAATILTAAISYELMEKPILRLKRRFEIVKTRNA